MAKMLLAGGLVRDYWFDTLDALEKFIEGLENRCVGYYELERCSRPGGAYIIRIVTQYNNSEMIEL